jgi:membrane protease YdiL (CAAX protease family)
MARKSIILKLALATIIAMPMVAMIVDHFSETVDLKTALYGVTPVWQQIGLGALAGLVIAIVAQFIIASPILEKVNVQYANVLGRFKLNLSEITFVSLCAGVGEEILFRGAIQPFFGIIITSFLFVAIHGYINPFNWRLTIYGLYMTIGICILGYLSNTQGLLSAITAHTIIDIYLLYFLQKTAGQIPISENHNLEDTPESNDDDLFN